MAIHITGAPCCWGVDDVRNPYLPPWQKVLYEAGQAGYKAIELGPYGYLPLDIEVVSAELRKNGISIVAGTIFDDLLSEENYPQVLKQVDDICGIITKLPELPREPGQRYKTPYLTVMDWGHDERDYAAGHPDKAPRLSEEDWQRMMEHIKGIAKAADKWGVRAVVHPHAGGYIEFADEIDKLMEDIPAEVAGLCLDTGHLRYSGMEPVEWLRKYADRLDYIHFKDINEKVYTRQPAGLPPSTAAPCTARKSALWAPRLPLSGLMSVPTSFLTRWKASLCAFWSAAAPISIPRHGRKTASAAATRKASLMPVPPG